MLIILVFERYLTLLRTGKNRLPATLSEADRHGNAKASKNGYSILDA